MSLTGFLKQSEEVRTLLRKHFPCPLKSISFPLVQAPPLTGNYALIGQAFDYLLRFYMQRNNPYAPKQSHWVANFIKAQLSVHDGEDEQRHQRRTMEASALPLLEEAHIHHERYLVDGKVTDELLGSCFNLAIIDGLVRAGEMRGTLGKMEPKDIRDLRNLLALIPSSPFLSESPCVLNPIFPFPSGADCDLLIGDTLIEIKTTKFSEMKQEYYQQLLGYYLLNLDSSRSYPIQRIGVYFSRHGYLWTTDIKDVASDALFLQFLPQWNELVQRYHGKRTREESIQPHILEELITQSDMLSRSSQYMHWLSQLSNADFALWKGFPTAFCYVSGAIEYEQERREKMKSR